MSTTEDLSLLFPPAHLSSLGPDSLPSTSPPAPPMSINRKKKKQNKKPKKHNKVVSKKKKLTIDDIPSLHSELVDVLSKDDLFIIRHMCNLIKREEVDVQSRLFVKILQAKKGNFLMDLLKVLIQWEVDTTLGEGTLFRNNNMVVAMLSSHARTLGLQYLREVITPLIQSVLKTDKNMEIDPQKLENPEDIDQIAKNSANLISVLDEILNKIIDSVNIIPDDIRHICYLIQDSTKIKYPNSLYTCIGGFYFLRFVCPAFVAPDGFKLVDEPLDMRERRPFVLISKILQNLSNNTISKEDFMDPINAWITTNIPRVNAFFDDLPAEVGPSSYEGLENDITEIEFQKLISLLQRNIEDLEQRFEEVSDGFVQDHHYDPIAFLKDLFENLEEAEGYDPKKKKKNPK